MHSNCEMRHFIFKFQFESFPEYLAIFLVYVSHYKIPFFASLMVYQNGTSDPAGIRT